MSSKTPGLSWQRILGYSLISTLISVAAASADVTGAIATDGTMGAAQTLDGVNVTVAQSLGTTAGNNLFHSFAEFNINTGQTVTFTGADNLRNVFARVTGTDITEIDGTLKSGIANAAFYFINPNGIVFGENAQVDVPGSFHITTADKIVFPDNDAAFYADRSRASTLSSAAPAAFGFLDTTAVNNGLIAVDGAQLAAKTGQTLDVVAGGITIQNYANVNAPAGEIRLVAMQGAGAVSVEQTVDGVLPLPAAQPSAANAGRIAVNYSGVGASGDGGGRISLWAGNTSFVNNSAVYADNEGDRDAASMKGIDIHSYALSVDKSLVAFDAYVGGGKAGSVLVAAKNLDIFNGGAISSSSLSAGDAGKVQVVADTLRIDRQDAHNQTGIASDALEDSSGNAGTVTVSARNLEIVNGGTISSDTLSSGNAGAILVEADTLRIDGQGGDRQTGIASDAVKGSSGNAGGVVVNAKNLDILSIGAISSNTWSTGNAGTVLVAADKLRIDGQGNTNAGTGIFTGVYSTEQHSGNGGDLAVQAGTLDIFKGGLISSSTFSEGKAGRVLVEAASLNIDSQGFLSWQTGIVSKAESGSNGSAGDLVVRAGKLDIVNSGVISSSTLSEGNAGKVQVAADMLRIDGQGGDRQTGIASDAVKGSSGDAGIVTVSAKSLDILNIGSISSNTWSTGNAGTVQVVADKLRIDGQGNDQAVTGIFTEVYSTEQHSGNAGDLAVQAGTLDIFNGGLISSSTFSDGNAGKVQVAADTLRIDGQGGDKQTGIASDALKGSSGNAGSVAVTAKNLDILSIGSISSNTWSTGDAGTVLVAADKLRIDGQGNDNAGTGIFTAVYSTEQHSGNGGDLAVQAGTLDIVNGGVVSSSTFSEGNAGSVKVAADTLRIDGQGGSKQTGIASNAVKGSSGNAGDLSVQAGALDIVNGGVISSSTFSEGNAGRVLVEAASLNIDSQGFLSWQAGIFSKAESGSSGNAGDLTVQAGKLNLVNAGLVSSSTLSSGHAGTIKVAADTLRIDGQGGDRQTGIASDAGRGSSGNAGSVAVTAKNLDILSIGSISSNTWSTGNAGTVQVVADKLRIDGQGNTNAGTGIFTGVYSTEQHSGNGGDLSVQAGTLDIVNGGVISSSTFSEGNAGRVLVEAASLNIDSQGFLSWQAGIFSKAESGSSGNAGDLAVQAGKLNLVNAGLVSSSTLSSGHAGTIKVAADTLRIDGQGGDRQAGIASDAAKGSSGNAGSVTVSAKNLEILNGGTISSDTLSSGHAGTLKVAADTLRIDGQGGSKQTGIASDSVEGSSGDAGSVTVSAKSLDILSIGSISSNTWSTGNAGTVKVTADKLRLDGQGNTNAGTGIFTGVYSYEQHSGNGGDLNIQAGTLDIVNGGSISSSTFSEGKAGRVLVEAASLNIDSHGFLLWQTGISAEAQADSGGQTGDVLVKASAGVRLLNNGKISIENAGNPDNPAAITPGSITITAPDIDMNNSEITSNSTGNVAAGNIVINFSHWLTMDPSFISTTANTGNGGSITINGGEAIYLQDSGFKTTVSGADSNGGDIYTTADTLAMNTGLIQANAVGGSGGNITLSLDSLIPSGNTLIKGGSAMAWRPFEPGFNVIQAASQAGVSGTVNVTAPQLNLSGIIANLGGPQFDTSIISQDYCGLGTGSSLTRKGTGGLKPKSGDQLLF